MFALHILGTSGSRPTATRSVSGNYLMTPHGGLVIDCGEGFQERLVRQDLRLKRSKEECTTCTNNVREENINIMYLGYLLMWCSSVAKDGCLTT